MPSSNELLQAVNDGVYILDRIDSDTKQLGIVTPRDEHGSAFILAAFEKRMGINQVAAANEICRRANAYKVLADTLQSLDAYFTEKDIALPPSLWAKVFQARGFYVTTNAAETEE